MGDSLMRLFPMAGWVAASQKNAPVNPRALANGIGRKGEAAYQCGLKSAIRGRTTPQMLRHRGHDRLLGSLMVDPNQLERLDPFREEAAA